MPSFSYDVLNRRDAFFLGLVSKHWSVDHITYGEDALYLGFQVLISLQAAVFVDLEAGFFKLESLGVSVSTSGNEDDIRFD